MMMMSLPRHPLTCTLVLLATLSMGQQSEDKLADLVTASPGRDRSNQLVELSIKERERGHYKEAIEYAMLSSVEAERSGLDKELARSLMELAKAHRAKGDLENAIGTTLRVTLVNGTYHSGVRTEALLQLAELYNKAGHPQKALEHLAEAAETTSAGRMDRARYLRAEAKAKSSVIKPESFVTYLNAQLPEVMGLDDRALELDMRALLATAQTNSGKHQEALLNEERILKLAIQLDRPMEAGICANNLGALNHRMGRPREALIAYAQGYIMVEDLPLVKLNMQVNAALAHAQLGGIDAALRLLGEAQQTLKKGTYEPMRPRVLRALAAVQIRQGDLGAAQSTSLDALAAAERSQNELEQAKVCELLMDILERRGLQQEAKVYERKASDLKLRREQHQAQDKSDRESQLLRLQRIEREQTDILNREQRKETKLKQLSLDAENREKQMSLLIYEKQLEEAARREAVMAHERAEGELQLIQATLETERQERMIEELDNGRMIQTLNLTRLRLEKKDQKRVMELLEERNALVEAQRVIDRTARSYTAIIAAGCGIIALLMAWAWISARRKKRTILLQNEKIQGINKELVVKNNDIQSSLSYARTIQSAIIPSESDLKACMTESFLLYKPLDIVSGDLPFVKRVGNKIHVAAIDCTGHGVPAAMMTFIAYYGLNDLLLQYAHEPRGKILDRLHLHVRQTMESRGEETLYNDGFDIGLCTIDLDTGELSFAGAQLPVLLVSRGSVERVKGDILPLGDKHFERKVGYHTHSLTLYDGDSLYLMSDGLIHQLGGCDGRKKFSMKRFTEVLQETAHMDLHEVKEHTDRLFLEWKGEHPQTDDVLLIGMRYAA
jgi:serine phosphatase RsbU (regulator of sigma subunit)/tetratricopeptide (TPR) repeat protein